MDNTIDNIFDHTKLPQTGKELFEEILQYKNIKVELITSNNLKNGETYYQDHDEWVVILEGKAELEMEGTLYSLKAGDHLFIKKSTSHRVVKTSSKTLWLAVHIY